MIRISDNEENGIKVAFPGVFSRKIAPKTVYYFAGDGCVRYKCSGVEKEFMCKKHMIRQIVLFDLLFIKAKEYNYSIDNFWYNGSNLLKSTFPSMGIELTAEEYEIERKLLSDLSNGAIFLPQSKESDLGILIDLYASGGLK